MEAPEDVGETSEQTAASDEEQGTENKTSSSVIEIHDSMTECEEENHLVPTEEKAFVTSLHNFMKDRATPIERIPHLGFKQINLWRIYKAVEKLGGYDAVTARRLWKKVYDELGGSPGSTSAATCTRRHYEKLVLPFERHIKGEDDKPLPPSKPRKPYKRSSDGQVHKTEKKRKRCQLDSEMDSEIEAQRSPEATCQSEAVLHPHRALWTSDQHHLESAQPNRSTSNLCTTVYTRLVPVPTSSLWPAHVPTTAGEVISPLEKKKRMAQASLNVPMSPQSEDKERPSVIHCSGSPSRASSSHNSSDGSPLPLSSSSSRSPSPYSVSSEDGPVESEGKPASSSELTQNCSSSVNKASSGGGEGNKTSSCTHISKDTARENKDDSCASPESVDPIKIEIKDSAWRSIHKGSNKHISHSVPSPSSYSVISEWPTSNSSFTKVIPKSVQLMRPAPIRPSYKLHQDKLIHQVDSLISARKQNNTAPWIYQTEKREKSRTMLQKVHSTQQSASASSTSMPMSRVLSSVDKSVKDSRHYPLHPAFFPNRMRLPQSQFLYHHLPMSPAHSALIGSAVYPYYPSVPLFNPQLGYTLPAMGQIYRQKM